MSNFYIGIDPGQKGAIAIIEDNKEPIVYDMPLLPNNELDSTELFNILMFPLPNNRIYCMLEKSHPMPKQGVKGVFSYGESYGALKAVLRISSIPFKEIHPLKWKKHFSLSKNKKKSITTCLNLFPNAELYDHKGSIKDGRAEALLLAFYAQQNKA